MGKNNISDIAKEVNDIHGSMGKHAKWQVIGSEVYVTPKTRRGSVVCKIVSKFWHDFEKDTLAGRYKFPLPSEYMVVRRKLGG